jgi:hypothetical protein
MPVLSPQIPRAMSARVLERQLVLAVWRARARLLLLRLVWHRIENPGLGIIGDAKGSTALTYAAFKGKTDAMFRLCEIWVVGEPIYAAHMSVILDGWKMSRGVGWRM